MTFKQFLIVFMFAPLAASAQYYSTGESPASLRWRELRTPDLRVVFPEGAEGLAARALKYMDTVRPYVRYGYRHGTMRTPLVLHTQNFLSNGIVLWAPKRIEFITVPEANAYSEPWLKELATHEYRHNVQYNNQNRGWVRGLSYVLGQQGPLAALILMPIWYLEGDAVLCETQLSSYGRGVQPSFTIDYRMYYDQMRFDLGTPRPPDAPKPFARDKWFSGSFKDYVPDHYSLGYQLVSYTDNRYGPDFWDKVVHFSSRNTYMILTKNIALRRYYHTSVHKIFDETFAELGAHWDSIPRVENSAAIVPRLSVTSYTSYSSPVALTDSTSLAFKWDLDRPNRIVRISTRGGEQQLAHTGSPSSRMSYANGRIYWTEYRQSTLWPQRVNSQLYVMEFDGGGRPRAVRGERRALYPVAMSDGYALAEYEYDGTYVLKYGARRLALPDTISVHGLAFDDVTRNFYFIGLSDGGMWFGAADEALTTFRAVTRPAHITVANLSARGGRLYFNSIASGKDEAHLYDLASGAEYRISTSTYGSFAPSTADGHNIVMTTFGPHGYLLSTQTLGGAEVATGAESVPARVEAKRLAGRSPQSVEEGGTTDCLTALERIDPAPLPRDVVNPARKRWNIMNIDSVKVDASLTLHKADTTYAIKERRYHAALHLLDFHSWAPFWFDPNNILSGNAPTVYAGVTLISQNLLNSMVSTFGYAYTPDGSMLTANIDYLGLPVKLGLAVQYGGGDQNVRLLARPVGWTPRLKPYFGIGPQAYIPFVLSSGYRSRALTPSVSFIYDNTVTVDRDLLKRDGAQRMTLALQYSENVRPAVKDFLPRYGYTLRVSNTFAPLDDRYAQLYSVFARAFLPGFAPHHSIRLRASYQYQTLSPMFGFQQMELAPWGTPSGLRITRYNAAALDYQLPVWYPDGGINSILYFRRLRVNAGSCVAQYRDVGRRWHDLYSYGGDLLVDFVPARTPANVNLTLTLSAYYSGRGMQYGWNLSIPF